MKRFFLFLLPILIAGLTACVSKSDYKNAQYSASYWEEMYYAQQQEHQKLIKDYNELVDEYNDLLEESKSQECAIINARNKLHTLENHFEYFLYGRFYDADDIESDIRDIENHLNSW